MSANKLSNQLSTIVFSTFTNKFLLAASLIVIFFGQTVIRETQPLQHLGQLAELFTHWNEKLYWSLKNPVNVLFGLFLIIIGGIVSSLAFRPHLSIQSIQRPQTFFLELISWNTQNFPKLSRPWLFVSAALFVSINIQLAQHYYSTFIFWLWVLAIIIPTTLFLKNEYKTLFTLDPSISYLDGVFVFTLFAFAIAAGSYYLNDFPAGWVQDEGPFWTMARKIALGLEKPPFFDFGVFTFPVASSYVQGWILRWSGINIWGWRFSSVLPAALTIFPLYFLAHLLFDRRIAITACVLMVVNPYFLLFMRLGYNNSQSLLPVCASIYLFALALQKNSFFYLWLTGLMAGLGFYTYFAAWLGVATLFVAILSLSLISKIKTNKTLSILLVVVAGIIVLLVPRVAYSISGKTPLLLHFKVWETGAINTYYGREVFGDTRIASAKIIKINDAVEVYYDPALYGLTLLRGTLRTIAGLFDPLGYIDHSITYGMAGPGSSVFFVLGLGLILANSKKIIFFIPSAWFLVGFISLGVLASLPPRPTHMVALIPVISLIASIGLIYFLDAITSTATQHSNKKTQRKTILTIGILFLISVMGFLHFFYLNPYFFYPPNQDDYISWLGRQFPTSSKLILVDHYSTTRNPVDETLLKLSEHSLLITTQKNLGTNPDQIKSWTNYVAFIDWHDGKEYAEWVAKQTPNSTMQIAYAPGQRFRGYVVSDLQIDANMDYNFLNSLQDLWGSPARSILFFCGAVIIIFFVIGNTKFSS